jgi:hypothetical protein
MTHKQIHDKLKQSAKRIQRIDHSTRILERLHDYEDNVLETKTKKVHLMRFIPNVLMIATLIILITMTLSIDIQKNPFEVSIQAYDHTLMTSVIQLSMVILEDNTVTTKSLQTLNSTSDIESEVENLAQYFPLMEYMLKSEATYEMEVLFDHQNLYQRSLRFKTKDFVGESFIYTLHVKKEVNRLDHITTLDAILIIEDQVFPILIILDEKNMNTIITRYDHHDTVIEVISSNQDLETTYEMNVHVNGQIKRNVKVRKHIEADYFELILNQNQNQGKYRFKMVLENTFSIDYDITSDARVETGQIDVEIEERENQGKAYGITLRPKGRPEIFMNPRRPETPKPPKDNPNRPF